MKKEYDVIVIGAGNGGLTAAARTAQAGFRTLLLEKHNIPGGCATSFRRGRFEFDTSLHGVASFGSEDNPGSIRKIFADLGVDLEWKADEEWVRAIITGKEGFDVTLSTDRNTYIERMEEAVPGCRESVEKMFELGDECMKALGYLGRGAVDPKVLISEHADFMKCASYTMDEVLEYVKMPVKARNIMTSCWTYLGTPTNELKALHYCLMLVGYCACKAYVPRKRSYSISLSLAELVKKYGGDIWYNTEVVKLLVKNGQAYGVETLTGEKLYARKVISNVIPTNIYGLMTDENEIPSLAKQLANARKLAFSSVNVYLGLNKSVKELGIKDYSMLIDTIPESRNQFKRFFDLNENHYIATCCPNVIFPDASPEGTAILSITQNYMTPSWDNVTPENYKETKNRVASRIIKDFEDATGIHIKENIEEIEVATPATFARYLGTPGGTMYGYFSGGWDNLMNRVLARKTEDEPLKGLRFCGGHSYKTSGYSSSYETGYMMANLTIDDLKEGK